MADDLALKTPDARASSLPNGLDLATLLLQHEVEQFYYQEAAFLDDRRYRDWLALFTPDIHYFMPIRRTKTTKDLAREFTRPGDMAFFDDDHFMLTARVKKIETGYAWAEDPPSRQRHLVTNVRIVDQDADTLEVETGFHFYRTRLHSEEDTWIGHRKDTLRRVEGQLRIARRTIYLEQTILLARNLSNFF